MSPSHREKIILNVFKNRNYLFFENNIFFIASGTSILPIGRSGPVSHRGRSLRSKLQQKNRSKMTWYQIVREICTNKALRCVLRFGVLLVADVLQMALDRYLPGLQGLRGPTAWRMMRR